MRYLTLAVVTLHARGGVSDGAEAMRARRQTTRRQYVISATV